MELTINVSPPEQDMDMSTTDNRPQGDIPWYQLKLSIVMITVTILAAGGVAFDYTSTDQTPVSGFWIVENGTIVGGTRGDSYTR